MDKFSCLIGLVVLCAAPAFAAGPKADPDWPCHQPKVGEFPLASVWDNPPAAPQPAQGREDARIAALAATMAQRGAPLSEVQAGVAKLAAEPDGKPKVWQAFTAAFDDLVRQRAEVLAGLERYGRKNHQMVEHIRAENETAHRETAPGAGPDEAALQKLQWDLRIFEDRRRTAIFVCEAPQSIEARIGEIVKLVRPTL